MVGFPGFSAAAAAAAAQRRPRRRFPLSNNFFPSPIYLLPLRSPRKGGGNKVSQLHATKNRSGQTLPMLLSTSGKPQIVPRRKPNCDLLRRISCIIHMKWASPPPLSLSRNSFFSIPRALLSMKIGGGGRRTRFKIVSGALPRSLL